MEDAARYISFLIVPKPQGVAETEQRLRSAGFTQVTRSQDGQRLHVVAPRDAVEKIFGFPLREKRRKGRVATGVRDIVDLELPEGAVLPPSLRDVVSEVIFPVTPDYHQSPRQRKL
jgi:hypothetical protein